MHRKFSKLFLILCSMTPFAAAQGKIVSSDDARAEAAKFFKARGEDRLSVPGAFTLLQTVKDDTGNVSYYIFNAADSKGFVIIGADDEKEQILGFSYANSFGQMPPVLGQLLQNVPDKNTSTQKALSRLKVADRKRLQSEVVLETPEWSQEAPFNNKIPGRKLTGCVAVALAEVMKYYNFPSQGRGSAQDVDFNGVAYDWENMLMSNYRSGYSEAQGNAVSTLVSHAAASILTDFGQSASSAFEIRVPSALINHFGYDAGVSFRKRSEVSKEEWESILINEIANRRPVIYSGQDVSSGHAFVCDGYNPDTNMFHFNWGWGGAANGFFRSDMLNPRVSKQHNYNDQMTVIYNIKPGVGSTTWSGIHITSDNNQPGLTIDVSSVFAGGTFSLRAGALKNIENTGFSGKIVPVLCKGDGTMVQLSSPKGLNLPMLQVAEIIDFACSVPADVAIEEGDVIRLATQSSGSEEWLPVAGELDVYGEVKAVGSEVPTFAINLPTGVEGVTIQDAEPTVIKGRDYRFKVVSNNANNLVTVKSNGFILEKNANNEYTISNVRSNQQITILVQDASKVVNKKVVWVNAGNLSNLIAETESGTIKELVLFGSINANDFAFIREKMKLTSLDLSGVSIANNTVPQKALYNYDSMQKLVLPNGVTSFENGAFGDCDGLTEVEIPSSVSKFSTNVFVNCSRLRKVTSRMRTAPTINWCVFSGTPRAELVVNVGCAASYRAKDEWNKFANIREENKQEVSAYSVYVQEQKGISIQPDDMKTEYARYDKYSFTLKTDGSEGEATVEVYANNERIYPNAQGKYEVQILSNTVIYTALRQPMKAGSSSVWGLGEAGLVTEVINVVPGRSFTVRANTLNIPQNNANVSYAAVLTDGKGNIKEVISPIVSNMSYNYGNKVMDIVCTVRESSVKEGNTVMLATSLDNKMWSLVRGENEKVVDYISAVNNKVVYCDVKIPLVPEKYTVQGYTDKVVKGMPFQFKVLPNSVADGVVVYINGVPQGNQAAVANIQLPSVNSDLNITIDVAPLNADMVYEMVYVQPGELPSKITAYPEGTNLKVVGTMSPSDFKAFQNNPSRIKALDLSSVTIKGTASALEDNTLPYSAFVSGYAFSALQKITLPGTLTSIAPNAFRGCNKITELTLPESVTFMDFQALYDLTGMTKLIVNNPVPIIFKTGRSPFPRNVMLGNVEIEVPKGTATTYYETYLWNDFHYPYSQVYFYNIQVDPTRVRPWSVFSDQLTKIPESTPSVALAFPNAFREVQENVLMRPDDVFKVLVDGRDLYNSVLQGKFEESGTSAALFAEKNIFAETGQYKISMSSPAAKKNYKVDVVFHYNINLPANARFVETDVANVWNPDMRYFPRVGGNKGTVYKEGMDYRFVMPEAPEGMDLKVKQISKVCMKPGASRVVGNNGKVLRPYIAPEYETRETILFPDQNGVYTISDLQGDTSFEVILVPQEGAQLNCDQLKNVPAEDAKNVNNLAVEGEMDQATMDAIKNKFRNLENLDLSETTNSSLPDGMFEGMSNLKTVSVSENVTSIGADAFKGCRNLETLELNGVNSVGANAFSGCENLTSVIIGGRSTRAAEGIDPKAFEGSNPNMIVVVNDKSLVSGIENVNIVFNGNGTREAIRNIKVDTRHSFNSPVPFNLGAYTASTSLTIKSKESNDPDANWTGVILPYTPQIGSDIQVFSFTDESAEKMTEQNEILANKPCMIRAKSGGEQTIELTRSAGGAVAFFEGFEESQDDDQKVAYDVEATPGATDLVAKGKSHTLYGTYESVFAAADDYVLDSDGKLFVLNDMGNGQVASGKHSTFSVYARANNPENAEELKISDSRSNETGIENVNGVEFNGLRISKQGTLLVIESEQARVIEIFNLKGEKVATMRLKAGENSIQLSSGLYLIEGTKVLF